VPYELPGGFPSSLSDEELAGVVSQVVGNIQERFGRDVSPWLPELQLALLSVAISDQSRRQLVAGSRIALASLGVAGLALVVTIISLLST
jgi:hypothetical protein